MNPDPNTVTAEALKLDMMLGLTDVTMTGGSTDMLPTKTSLIVISSLNDTLTSPGISGATAHSTRPSPTTPATTTKESLRRAAVRTIHATRSSTRKTSPVKTTTVEETPLEMKGVASLNSAEGTTVKLRAGAVTGLNSSKEESAPDSFNATDINFIELNPRADAMHASVFSAQPPSEHAICTTRPQT